MKYPILAGLALAAVSPALAHAEEALPAGGDNRENSITVVATGSRSMLGETGQSVSVIGADELAQVQGPDLTRSLERLPGVVIARSGGLGSLSSVFVRGANSEQLLVLVDGIRVNDVASPGGAYDMGNLMAGGLGKVELLRGSNSVVWGSQAIGGVLAVSSREFTGAEGSVEYGAHGSFDGQANAGLETARMAINLGAGYTRSHGISAAASGSEPDGMRQWRANGTARVKLMTGLAAEFAGRYADSRIEIDGFPAPAYVLADTAEYQKTREVAARAGLHYLDDNLELSAGYAVSDTRRAYYDAEIGSDPNFRTKGRSGRLELIGTWQAGHGLRLDFGADRERTRFVTTFEPRASARLSSVHALLGWSGRGVNLAAGLRLDDHSRFGSQWTFGGNASVAVVDGWRVRASYGEGFKAPTLYQIHSEYGNRDLQPERSHSIDLGLEKGSRNDPLHMAIVAFQRQTRQLIDFVSCFSVTDPLCGDGRFGFYANVARARARGVELELGARISGTLRAGLAYTWLDAQNRTRGAPDFGKALARRPRHTLALNLDWTTPFHGLVLGADVRMVGDSFDDAAHFTRIDGHATATLRASMPVGEHVELFGRIENLTDERYQEVAGYSTQGRAAFAGVRARI